MLERVYHSLRKLMLGILVVKNYVSLLMAKLKFKSYWTLPWLFFLIIVAVRSFSVFSTAASISWGNSDCRVSTMALKYPEIGIIINVRVGFQSFQIERARLVKVPYLWKILGHWDILLLNFTSIGFTNFL